MTLQKILIQELETASDEVLSETINFVQFLKTRHPLKQTVPKPDNNIDIQAPPEKKCTVGDLLQFVGKWQGDDE
jgi:hypothetical protein